MHALPLQPSRTHDVQQIKRCPKTAVPYRSVDAWQTCRSRHRKDAILGREIGNCLIVLEFRDARWRNKEDMVRKPYYVWQLIGGSAPPTAE
jgi:hypothetical protein